MPLPEVLVLMVEPQSVSKLVGQIRVMSVPLGPPQLPTVWNKVVYKEPRQPTDQRGRNLNYKHRPA